MKFFKYQFASLLLLILSLQIDAQDSTFLESLPKEARERLENQNNGENLDKKNFKLPDTSVELVDSELQKIKTQLQRLENDLLREKTEHQAIKFFGEDFFSSFQSTFMPINQGIYNGDYILNFGDSLNIQMIGGTSTRSLEEIEVERDGSIFLKDVGKIMIAGMTLDQAANHISNIVKESLIGVEIFMSLSKIRDISVLVIGNVTKPGQYTLPGNSSVLMALHSVGGITDRGSFREIVIKRNNEVIDVVDLYKALGLGETKFNHSLQDGDVILVKPKGDFIAVSGENLSADRLYEIMPGETFSSILKFSGDNNVRFTKLIKSQSGKETDLTNQLFQDIEINHGDSFKFISFKPNPAKVITVKISGEVMQPGTYSISKDTIISELIESAGGYTSRAYPFGGVLSRESVKRLENELRDKTYYDLLKYISAKGPAPGIDGIIEILDDIRSADPIGRVTVEFDIAKLQSTEYSDTYLEDGDKIFIPPFSKKVYVFGEVLNTGSKDHVEGNNSFSYIKLAGGLTEYADKSKIILIHPNGDSFLVENSSFMGINRSGAVVYPGSILYVPRKLNMLDGTEYVATITNLFSNLALTLASLNSVFE